VPQYDPTWFVNREREIRLVLDKAAAIAGGEPVRERAIVFWGYRGSGRTWLLRRLTELLEEIPGMTSAYLDLAWYTSQPIEEVIRDLFVRAAGSIWGPDSDQASLYSRAVDIPFSTVAAWLIRDVRDFLQERALVLLLDHVYESDWELLELLEDEILALLAVQPHVLIVMAGRGRAYPWKTPELRLYTEEHYLQPFDEPLTEKQLKKQTPEAVARTPQIYQMSQGYPLGNYLLATRPTVAQAMQEVVDALLDGVPARERSWLEALCVLRAFDEERIPILVAAYFDDPAIRNWPYKEVRQVRDRLLQTALLRWSEDAGGWELDQAMRPVLEKYLEQSKPDVWQRLHCAAYRLYRYWEKQYPDEQQRWQDEARYHAKRLRDAGLDPDECL